MEILNIYYLNTHFDEYKFRENLTFWGRVDQFSAGWNTDFGSEWFSAFLSLSEEREEEVFHLIAKGSSFRALCLDEGERIFNQIAEKFQIPVKFHWEIIRELANFVSHKLRKTQRAVNEAIARRFASIIYICGDKELWNLKGKNLENVKKIVSEMDCEGVKIEIVEGWESFVKRCGYIVNDNWGIGFLMVPCCFEPPFVYGLNDKNKKLWRVRNRLWENILLPNKRS